MHGKKFWSAATFVVVTQRTMVLTRQKGDSFERAAVQKRSYSVALAAFGNESK